MNKAKPKDKKVKQWVAGPGRLALCRVMAGDDIAAGALLYRIVGLWEFQKNKLERGNREWLAMPRPAWARSAGLTLAEFDKRALKRVKKHCSELVTFSTQRIVYNDVNKLWISLNYDAFLEAEQHVKDNWEMIELSQKGEGIGFNKTPKYLGKSDMI